MTASEMDQLRAEVERLRSENESLRDTTPIEPTPAPAPRHAGRWRAWVSALCIVIATILVPVSIVSAWARVQLVNEEAFVSTLAPLAEDPAVQQLVIDETMDAVNAQVDFQEITSNVFDGIAQLGLPPRAEQALQLLEAPAASGLESLVTQTVTRVVESEAFVEVWATTTRAAHRALTAAATSDGGGVVVMTDEGVGIQLGAIVDRVKQNLIDRGIGAAQIIPEIDRVVIIGSGTALVTIRTAYAIADAAGWWLPLISLGLFGLGILIARRRSTAVLGTGIGFVVGGSVLALGFAIGYPVVGQTAVSLDLSPAALDVIYGAMIESMRQTALIVALLGVLIAVIGWFMGRSEPAVRSREFVRGMNASTRRWLAGRGLDTGAFGAGLARYRVLIRAVIAVTAVLWLYALRPLSLGDVFVVVLVSFAGAWVLELLQNRPEEHAAPTPEEAALTAEAAAIDAEAAAEDAEVAAGDAEAAAARALAVHSGGSVTADASAATVAESAVATLEAEEPVVAEEPVGAEEPVPTADAPASAPEEGGAEASGTAKKPRPRR